MAGTRRRMSFGWIAVAMANTRRKDTAVATATPAARRLGAPSPAAARRALVSVTAVDETNPPRGCGQQYAAADAENLHREISEERYAGEQDGDDPDLARIDAAEWSNRIVLQDR